MINSSLFFCLGSYISAVVYSHPESSEVNIGGGLFVYAGVLVSSSLIFPVKPVGGRVGDSSQCYPAGPRCHFPGVFLLLSLLLLVFLLLDLHSLAGLRS